MRVSNPENNPFLEGCKTVDKLFLYFIGLMFGGVAFSSYFLLLIGWFFSTITGFTAQKAGGPIIWKTFGNLIWDYKYIWATLAIGIWLLNLKFI